MRHIFQITERPIEHLEFITPNDFTDESLVGHVTHLSDDEIEHAISELAQKIEGIGEINGRELIFNESVRDFYGGPCIDVLSDVIAMGNGDAEWDEDVVPAFQETPKKVKDMFVYPGVEKNAEPFSPLLAWVFFGRKHDTTLYIGGVLGIDT